MDPKPSLGSNEVAWQELQANHFLNQMGAFQQQQTLLAASLGGVEFPQALDQRITPAGDQLGGAMPIQCHLKRVVTAHMQTVLHHELLAL